MTGLSKITDKIISDAKADAAKRLAEADAECKKINKEYATVARAATEKLNAEAKKSASEIVARAKSGERTVRKDSVLTLRADMIDRAFEIAQNELLALDDERRLDMLLRMLSSVLKAELEGERARAAEESDFSAPSYEVLLNQKDREKLGERLMETYRRSIVGRDMGDLPSRLTLSADTVNIGGGLVVRVGDVEINSSVESVIAYLRPKLEGKIEKILFPQQA